MKIDLSLITGASYAGAPRDYTIMFVTKKVDYLLSNLNGRKGCIVFVDEGAEIPAELMKKNTFVRSDNPQYAYANAANELWNRQMKTESMLKYRLTDGGYYVGENVSIGENAYIEPGVVIGHNVKIGNDAVILAGSVIKRSLIGDNFFCNENANVGANGFTMAEDEQGNKFRIPSLGKLMIGNSVEVGSHDNIACGSAGDTIISDFVKLDALVHIGHDVYLGKNVEITAGGIIGGFVCIGNNAYVGINAVIRNRITIGERAFVGMGATVTKSVEENTTVAGNPAKLFVRKDK